MAENTRRPPAADGHKVVYLLIETGANGDRRTLWRPAGRGYPCRDGSLNVKLDIHPGLTFNVRTPKSGGEAAEAERLPADRDVTELADYPDGDGENDRTFTCADCLAETCNEEARAVYFGGAVCGGCAERYKPCGRCGYHFPRALRGTHCPNCAGAGAAAKGGDGNGNRRRA